MEKKYISIDQDTTELTDEMIKLMASNFTDENGKMKYDVLDLSVAEEINTALEREKAIPKKDR